ncbi:lutropin subunit beta [Hyperolius riggenbachi]|uniref:lutropin subunit beta n=1 Tax=Hyperolius riggenbachi TaxID=752182 RepID=UPI0035A3A040
MKRWTSPKPVVSVRFLLPTCRMFTLRMMFLHLVVYLSAVQASHQCHLTNVTISAEKEHCPCTTFTATICTGHCKTYDPVIKSARSSFKQEICTYKEFRYENIPLQGCTPGTDPYFTYPVALSCECSQCKMDYSDCTVESSEPDVCMNKNHIAI